MFILIDKFRMAVVYRHPKVEVLRALANIELAHVGIRIMEESDPAGFADFTVHQLQDLFKNLVGGVDPHSHNASYIIGQIIRLCQTVPPIIIDGFKATVQSLQIKANSKAFYKYAGDKPLVVELDEPYNPPALVGNWNAAQGLPLPSAPMHAPTPTQAPATARPWVTPAPPTAPLKYAPPWA